MTIEEYYNLNIGDTIYNIKTNVITELSGVWSYGKERLETDTLSSEILGEQYGYVNIPVLECGDWNFISESAPLEVKFKLLSKRFFELEQFVYQRLR